MVTNYVLNEELQISEFVDNIDRRDGQKLWIFDPIWNGDEARSSRLR